MLAHTCPHVHCHSVEGMCPSVTHCMMDVRAEAEWTKQDLRRYMHMMDDRRRANPSQQRSQRMTLLYGSAFFTASRYVGETLILNSS